MNCLDSISVWFACKLCNCYLSNVEHFIEHKRDLHFTEFQKTRCIVLEERSVAAQQENSAGVAAPRIKSSTRVENQVNLSIGQPTNDLVDPDQMTSCEQKNNKGSKNLKNVQVFVQKLTPQQIQDACYPDHLENIVKVEDALTSNFDIDDDNFGAETMETDAADDESSNFIQIQSPRAIAKPPDDFDCRVCFEKLNSDAELRLHVEACARVNKGHSCYCLDCNKLLAKAEYLRNHRLTFHATAEEVAMRAKYTCPLCSMKFVFKPRWKNHVESHKPLEEREKPFKCQFCDKAFPVRSNLTHHLKSHSSEKPFKCHHENCTSAYKFRQDLRRHLTTHSDERPFSCPLSGCDKAFKNQRLLRSHLNTHSRHLLLTLKC